MEIQYTLASIKEAALQVWAAAKDSRVLAFHGPMGSGKTTLIHALCDVKDVSSTVGSPTFALINEYRYSEGKIFHIDLYRLKDAEEAIRAGVEDCLYSGDLCLVEWPERAESIFPENTLGIFLRIINPETRLLRIGDN